MKVIEQTADRLTLEDRPVFLGFMAGFFILAFAWNGISALLAGDLVTGFGALAIAIAVAALAFGVLIQVSQLRLDRTEGLIRLRRIKASGTTEQSFPLDALHRVEVETLRGSRKGAGSTHRPVLVLGEDQRRVPLTAAYASGRGAEITAETINRWWRPVSDG